MEKIEKRYLFCDDIEVRADADKPTQLIGYAAVFNSRSKDMGFFEEVDPGAFNKTLKENRSIVALQNHDPNRVLGSVQNETLQLSTDQRGLKAVVNLPDTTYANDLAKSIQRGDMKGMSFAFKRVPQGDVFEKRGGVTTRVLKEVKLYEISFGVPFPAYEGTTSSVRSYFESVGMSKDEIDSYEKASEQQKRNADTTPPTGTEAVTDNWKVEIEDAKNRLLKIL